MSAATLNEAIAARVAAIRGGIDGKIVRLRVWNVPRHIARELDHAAIRGYKSRGPAFQSRSPAARGPAHDRGRIARPPPDSPRAGAGIPRETTPARQLQREDFVRLGVELMDAVERELVET